MTRKFKGSAEGRGFKQRGTGLRAGVDAIQAQRKIEIDALQLAKLQHKEASGNWIAGLGDSLNFTERVQKQKNDLEQKVRTRKYEALSELARTDVARLEGEAKQAKERADYLRDLAPKQAKMVQGLVTGIWQFQDTIRGIGEYNALDGSGLLDQIIDGQVKAEGNLFESLHKDHRKLIIEAQKTGDWSKVVEANALWNKKKLSTAYARKKFLDFVKKNKANITSEVHAEIGNFKDSDGNPIKLNEANTKAYHELYIHQLLKQVGIKPTTKQGREIINIYKNAGRIDYKGKVDQRVYTEDNSKIELQSKVVSITATNDPTFNSEFNSLITLIKGRTVKYGNKYLRGHENGMSWSDAYVSAGKALVDAGLNNLDEDKLLELLATARTMPTPGNEKSEPYVTKLPVQTEQILDYYREKRSKKISENAGVIAEHDKTARTKINRELKNKPWLYKTDTNGELVLEEGKPVELTKETGLMTMEDWKWKTLRSTADNSQISADAKNYIYEKLQFIGVDAKIDDKFILISDLFKTDQADKARTLIDSASAAEQEKLNKLFEEQQFLQKAIKPFKAPGSETINTGGKAGLARVRHTVFIPAEGQNFNAFSKLHESAGDAIVAFDNAVDQMTLDLRTDPRFKDNPEGAYEEAFKIIKAEYDAGADGKTGRWARTGSTTVKKGDSPTQLIYTHFRSDLRDNDKDRLSFLWGEKGEERDKAAQELLQYKGETWDGPMTTKILEHRLLSEGAISTENEAALLVDQSFLNGSWVQNTHSELTRINNGEMGIWGYPPQLKAYAKFKGITDRKALQTVLDVYAKQGLLPEITVPLETADLTKEVKNNNKPYLNRNESAVCAFSACKSQLVDPKSWNVVYTLDGFDKESALAKSLDVGFNWDGEGSMVFDNPQDALKPEFFYSNMINWNTAEKLNLVPFDFWNKQIFTKYGDPVSELGNLSPVELHNRKVNSGEKDGKIISRSTDRYRTDRGSL
tara:strand:- start:1353 stop:4283 length:2931 start_codon:yes stop_codon:yes gene_type:complete